MDSRERYPEREETNRISFFPDRIAEVLSPDTIRRDKTVEQHWGGPNAVNLTYLYSPKFKSSSSFRRKPESRLSVSRLEFIPRTAGPG